MRVKLICNKWQDKGKYGGDMGYSGGDGKHPIITNSVFYRS